MVKVLYLIGFFGTFLYADLTIERRRHDLIDAAASILAALTVAAIWPVSLPVRLLGYPYAAWQRRQEGNNGR